MRNIYILPTSQPSRLFIYEGTLGLAEGLQYGSNTIQNQNIFITCNEKTKVGDWVLGDFPDNPIGKVISKYGEEFTVQSLNGDKHGLAQYDSNKIILTDNKDLIADGVQPIDDEFLEWFVKNPSCEWVEVEKFRSYKEIDSPYEYIPIIPKEEPKQETLEEAAKNYAKQFDWAEDSSPQIDFIEGAKWQAKRMYSEEELQNAFYNGWLYRGEDYQFPKAKKELVEQFKKK